VDSVQREQHIQTVCLLILSMVAVAVALWWLRPVMIPFVLATFFSVALSPLIAFQIRVLRVPRPLAMLATLVFGCAILMVLGGLISVSVGQLAANTDVYQRQINQLLDRAMVLLERFGFNPVMTFNALSAVPIQMVSGMLASTTKAILDLLSQGLLVVVFLFFLLIGDTLRPEPRRGVLGEIERRIHRYIATKAVLSAATGACVWLVLAALGIDLAMMFRLFAFLLNFIPSIGSLVATLLPLPVVLVNPANTVTTMTLAIALPAVIQFVIGNVIEPRIMGGSLDLHPITILLALIVWGMLWGIVGMLLATPLTAVMKIFFERIEHTRAFADLLAGRLERFQTD
jgi:AI-2 transport protein TqsA